MMYSIIPCHLPLSITVSTIGMGSELRSITRGCTVLYCISFWSPDTLHYSFHHWHGVRIEIYHQRLHITVSTITKIYQMQFLYSLDFEEETGMSSSDRHNR